MRQLLRSRQKKDSGVGGRKRPRRLSLWSEVRCFLGPYSQRCGHTHLSHIHTGRHVRLADRFFDLDLRASRSVAAHCPSGWWNIPSIPTQYVGANLTTLQVCTLHSAAKVLFSSQDMPDRGPTDLVSAFTFFNQTFTSQTYEY